MCYFVYIGVPARAWPALVDALAGLQCQKVNDPRLRAIFPPGDVVTEVTAGGCSCSLYAERPSRNNKRAQYEAKGWSESKIRRALANARPETPSQYVRFRDAIAAFVGSTGSLRILAHQDQGQRETIPPRHGTMSLADYVAREGTYPPEVLYDLRPDEPAGPGREDGR